MYLRCVCSCYGIEYVHCFEQSQHLLMHLDLTGVVARVRTARRLEFEGVDLEH